MGSANISDNVRNSSTLCLHREGCREQREIEEIITSLELRESRNFFEESAILSKLKKMVETCAAERCCFNGCRKTYPVIEIDGNNRLDLHQRSDIIFRV
jgi:hypothetical protein